MQKNLGLLLHYSPATSQFSLQQSRYNILIMQECRCAKPFGIHEQDISAFVEFIGFTKLVQRAEIAVQQLRSQSNMKFWTMMQGFNWRVQQVLN